MPLTWQLRLLTPFTACLIFSMSASEAVAAITPPRMEELVDSADLIVIGKVQSVQATSAALRWQIGRAVVVGAGVAISALLLWRRKVLDAVVVLAVFLIGAALWEFPSDAYRKVTHVSVSSTIKGTPPSANIPIYYETGFVCDATRFAAGEECLLFLKNDPAGYAMSWYDYGQWVINDGYSQTVRMTWNQAAPIALAELIAKIRLCEKQGKEGNRLP